MSTAAILSGCATQRLNKNKGHVAIVGGGFSGATVAKYIRIWSKGQIAVSMIERRKEFVSCPISNLVIVGNKNLSEITFSYDGLKKLGVNLIHDEVISIEPNNRSIRIKNGADITFDRCVLAPGVDFIYGDIPGLSSDSAQLKFPHAYKAGPQTLLLQKLIKNIPDGGTYLLAIPKMPYVCPPGPYERASLIADYFKKNKSRSKVIVADGNSEPQSKKNLFLGTWSNDYRGNLEYLPNMPLIDVDTEENFAIFDFDRIKSDVINVIPPQQIGKIGRSTGIRLINGRWADVNWLNLESKSHPNIHVIGDATFPSPLMPKSGHMANQQGKVLAAALVNIFNDMPPNTDPVVMNTCYSFVNTEMAMHVSSVFSFDKEKETFLSIPGAGGLSQASSHLEAMYALGWARNIWADTLSL